MFVLAARYAGKKELTRASRTANPSASAAVTGVIESPRSCGAKVGGRACFVMPTFEGDKWNNTERKQVIQECRLASSLLRRNAGAFHFFSLLPV